MLAGLRVLSCAVVLSAVPPATGGTIAYDVDYAAFADLRGDTAHSYVEIYFRADRWSLDVRSSSGGSRGSLFKRGEPDTLVVGFVADVVVVGASLDTLAREQHLVRQPLTEQNSGTAFDDLFTTVGLYLPPGSYRLTTALHDEISPTEVVRLEMPLVVRSYASPQPSLSDIELALSVARDETGSRYTKHGLSVLPNARCTFGFGAPILYYYTEVYHLGGGAGYQLAATFHDSAGNLARSLGPFPVEAQDPTTVQIKGLNVMGWLDGHYELAVSLLDSSGKALSTRSKGLTVNRAPYVTLPTIRKFIDDVAWIATREELTAFERVPQDQKAQYIQNFWLGRDPTPETPDNEMKLDHFRRLWLADQWFSEPGLPGRNSDQGRVLIQYGMPDDIERHTSSIEARPYQIWLYDRIAGGVQFVFVDFSGSGRMNLVHSNARDEIHNTDWRRLVEPFEGTLQQRQRRADDSRDRSR